MLCLLGFAGIAKAQASAESSPNSESIQWTMIKDDQGVKIYYYNTVCNNQNTIFIKVENTSAVNHALQVIVPGFVTNQNSASSLLFSLQANTTISSTCGSAKIPELCWNCKIDEKGIPSPEAFKIFQ